ncbi:SIR2 family protein [Photobacterium damselae subsp. damselae]|uniref:SIR2 family NAD-dependent protein deacylase n=1 Tax=Photobacterium damselae TaxID=38293 RepID=UPI001F16D149|nr:SIR2 family protein [Photobacterium damselae]UKA20676.1 SIR2 family protein [Photobacterium damselae subsp. damselae]
MRKALENGCLISFSRPPVTNRHLTETAGVGHARSHDFIFKPHGDAGDTESIILTREQYRMLLPGGERNAALETVKLLLASRPLVYIGFGLRDPDFLYLRDLLANTYKGGTRDHYALMADVSGNEISYWRNNYGIHLVNYDTYEDESGRRSHNHLLTLLDQLRECTKQALPENQIHAEVQEFSSQNILSLARHAGSLLTFTSVTPELNIRAKLIRSEVNDEQKNKRNRCSHYTLYSIDKLLGKDGPKKAIVTGLPGAGKSYSMKKSASVLAESLNNVCLAEEFSPEKVVVPIYVDLKLYDGDIKDLVSKSLSSSLSLDELDNKFRVRIFLDSFNEIPRDFIENGDYEKDIFKFIDDLNNSDVIIGSRTNDGLSKLNLPEYNLENIDYSYVDSEVINMGISFDSRFKNEIITMLQKPFFYNLFINGKVDLPERFNPIDLYRSYFEHLECAFSESYGFDLDLRACLSQVAYEALNNGVEALPLQIVLQFLKDQLKKQEIKSACESEVANWLVSRNLLIPYVNNKVAFFHQSITEYLAATELACKYQEDPDILRSVLSHTRWDQALFFTLPLLSNEQSERFLEHVMEIDLHLAIVASKYIETVKSEIVSKLLDKVIYRYKHYGREYRIEDAMINSLVVDVSHTDFLFKIVDFKNSLGGAAIQLLDRIKGEELKEYYFELMYTDRHDYNFIANEVSTVLKKYISNEDFYKIQCLVNRVDAPEPGEIIEDDLEGFLSGVANLLRSVNFSEVREYFFNAKKDNLPRMNGLILSRVIYDLSYDEINNEHLKFLVELLEYESTAATALYFICLGKGKDKLDFDIFQEEQLEQLIRYSMVPESWAVKAIQAICKCSPSFIALVDKKVDTIENHTVKVALQSIVSNDSSLIIEAMKALGKKSIEILSEEPLHILEELEVDWSGYETELMEVLILGEMKLSKIVLEQVRHKDLGNLPIEDVAPWLEMFSNYKTDLNIQWSAYLFGELLGNNLSQKKIRLFVEEFNSKNSKYRGLLSETILPQFDNLSTDDFSDVAISYLLSKLSQEEYRSPFSVPLLGRTCTKKFVNEFLLPLLSIEEQPLARNLRKVLLSAGQRHGKRYVSY